MSDYCHLEDPLNPSGAIDFMLSPDWEPVLHEVGGIFAPLGYNFQTDGWNQGRRRDPQTGVD